MLSITSIVFICVISHQAHQSLGFTVIDCKRTRRINSVIQQMVSPSGDNGGGTSVQRPPPRRSLKKRKNKRRERMDKLFQKETESIRNDDEIETRPVRRQDAVQAGLDYWMDDVDFEKERQRKIAVKNRKAMEGEISREKLRKEVVAPYKQNWIGIFSLVIVMLSTIVTKFPELMQIPVIPIPDL